MGKGGGGGGGHTPYEAPESGRSKQQVSVVEFISEGEIEGLIDGAKSIYLDDTALQNEDGTYNFPNVLWEGRVGIQDQAILKDFGYTAREVPVNAQAYQGIALVRTITDENIDRIRLTLGVKGLFSQNDKGDTYGAEVQFSIQIGSNSYTHTISGKYSGQYLQEIVYTDLPQVPFQIRVTRITPDSKSQRLQNVTFWSSYTEIVDTPFAYPNTAVMGLRFDSEAFGSIPKRTYGIRGIKCDVPSNYDPITRKYNGALWDGRFVKKWTNNPVWALYTFLFNERWGAGKRMKGKRVNKWAFYAAAQYCDEMVDDGFGGKEPRYTCNLWTAESRKLYDVLSDLCSIFRALPVWNGVELTLIMDRPQDPSWTYTNANVKDGMFDYSYSARKDRHNAIQVSYYNKHNGYKKSIEYLADDAAIIQDGLNVKRVNAYGCTSRGQALRTAKWILATEKYEKQMVTFTVGREGLMHIPGDIIRVVDSYYIGENFGGRILESNGNRIKLDRDISAASETHLTYLNTKAKESSIKVLSKQADGWLVVDGNPTDIQAGAYWFLSNSQVREKLFRAISVKDNGDNTYSISAIEHFPNKAQIVESGLSFEPLADSKLKAPVISNIDVQTNSDGSASINSQVSGGIGQKIIYDIKVLKDNRVYLTHLGLSQPNIDLNGLGNGTYTIVVTAKNEQGQVLSEEAKTFTIDIPPRPQNVSIIGGLTSNTLTWQWVDESTDTEILYAEVDNYEAAIRVARVTASMYSHEIGAGKVGYYWLRHFRGVNGGPLYQNTGLKAETHEDLKKQLDKVKPDVLVREMLDVALPARNLQLTKTVNDIVNVKAYQGYNQLYNLANHKLYVWDGTKYTADSKEFLASQLKGLLQPNQIASIPTSKLTGKIQASQLEANSVGTNALAAGAVSADKMAANSVTTAALQAGAVKADQLAANAVTAEKLAVGLGGNLLYNPIFANNADGWRDFNARGGDWNNCPATTAIGRGYHKNNYHPKGEQTEEWRLITLSGTQAQFNTLADRGSWVDICRQFVNVVADKWYMVSAYVGGFHCAGQIVVEKYNADENQYQGVIAVTPIAGHDDIHNRPNNFINAFSGHFIKGLGENVKRVFVKFKAPDTGKIFLVFRLNRYAKNQTYADFYLARPMLQECEEGTLEPGPWQNAGVTLIHGGSLKNQTVITEKLAARAVTTEKLAVGAVAAEHVAARAIDASKLNVQNLSAVSSNMGRITAGEIQIGALNGNFGTMFHLSNSGGFRLTSRDASGGIEINSATRALHVWDGAIEATRVGKL